MLRLQCCETLASNSSSACSSVAVNVVQELEDKERQNKNVLFFNISKPDASNLDVGRYYVSKLYKDTFNLDVKILEVFCLGKKVPNKCRPLLVQFEKENAKDKILVKSYLLKSMEPYSYVSVDMTKSERIKHKQLVDELKSRQAKGEMKIFILSNYIITKSRTKTHSPSNTNSATRVTLMESSS